MKTNMKDKIILVSILVVAVFFRQSITWSLLFSVASVAALWYLIEQLFPKQRLFKVLSTIFLAISPWYIKLSAESFNANLAIPLSIIGTLILLKIFKNGKWLYISVAVFILIMSQFPYPLKMNLTNAQDTVWLIDQQRREHGEAYKGIVAITFHNKAVNYSLSFLEHWGEHFSGDFLFLQGNITLMYLADILFIPVGLFNIFRKGDLNKWRVILLWLAVAPINSALNFAPPDFVKASMMIVPLVTTGGFGAAVLLKRLQTYLKDCTIKK